MQFERRWLCWTRVGGVGSCPPAGGGVSGPGGVANIKLVVSDPPFSLAVWGPKRDRVHLGLNRFKLVEAEKKAVSPRSEEWNKGESQQKPQESQPLQSQIPPEQGPPSLMVQLGLLQAETDR